MNASGFALFDTDLGPCGLAWRREALAGVQLAEGSAARTREALARRFPRLVEIAPPPEVEAAMAAIAAAVAGEAAPLDAIALDWRSVGTFEARVYALCRAIPRGRTSTYGEMAERLGGSGLARAVGQALGRNPWPIVIPCHRVLAASGRTGGFSAHGGARTKIRLLEREGALAPETLALFADRA